VENFDGQGKTEDEEILGSMRVAALAVVLGLAFWAVVVWLVVFA
jgi:hypothetical protein